MSRIQIPENDVSNSFHDVFVGWDNPLRTFFGQVYDSSADDDEQLIEWIGTDREEIFDLTTLCTLLEPYCTVNNEIRAELMANWTARTEPTPLQQMMPVSKYHLRNREYWDGERDG